MNSVRIRLAADHADADHRLSLRVRASARGHPRAGAAPRRHRGRAASGDGCGRSITGSTAVRVWTQKEVASWATRKGDDMTNEGWRDLVKQAVHEADAGQESMLDNLVQVLCDIDLAKQKLRDLGFGWTGMDILETVGEVEEWVQTVKDKTERTGALIDRLLACIPNAQERVTT